MIDKVSVQECAICGACINACPVDAISLDKVHLDLDILRSMKTFAFIATDVKRLVQFWGTKENLVRGIL